MTDRPNLSGEDGTLFRRFRTSVVSYGFRQIVVTLLVLLTNIILTRYLDPSQFGMVATVTIVMTIATLLADGGLGVYLIQRHAEVTQQDLYRVTTIQLMAAATVIVLSSAYWLITSFISSDGSVSGLVAIASLSLPFQVIRGMSLLTLERSLHIEKVVRVELLEQIAYMTTAIMTAHYGLGAWSIVVALLVKSLIGSLLAMLIGGFRPHLACPVWDDDLQHGLRFGLHYQASPLITMARVMIIPLFIIPTFGYEAGGFVDRAWYFAGAPLGILLAIQNKTIFPYVSRIQHDHSQLRRFIGDSIFVSAIVDKYLFLPLVLFTPEIMTLILSQKWLPMLPLMYWLLAGNILFGSLAGSLYPVANGIGRSPLVFRLNLAGFVLSWAFIIPLTLLFGITGIGIASMLLWFGIHWLKVRIVDHIGPFPYFRSALLPFLAFLASAAIYLIIRYATGSDIRSIADLFLWSLIVMSLYTAAIALIASNRLKQLYHHYRGLQHAS